MNILFRYWSELRSSFWFVPGLIIFGAVIIAIVLIKLDHFIDKRVLDRLPLLFSRGAEGSRVLLAAIATSMITVAGTVFSITIVALSLASNQYTSRVLRTFMRDHVNQTVMGVFVGIFAYCLVVLLAIQEGEEKFVPTLAVLFGVILGFVGVAFLIFFIHHIATSIHASRIIAEVFKETLKAVDRLFPEEAGGEDTGGTGTAQDYPGYTWYTVSASRTGYIQQIDMNELLEFAGEHGSVVRVERGIGEFLIEGTPVVFALATSPLNKKDTRRLSSVYTIGSERILEQDPAFGIRQLVDMSLKALSPGINDTTTAIMCVNYLTAILARLINRRIETHYWAGDGEVRVLTNSQTFAGLMAESFDQIRQNSGGNVAVLDRLLWSLETLADRTSIAARRHVLLEHTRAVVEFSRQTVPLPLDRQHIVSRSVRVIAMLDTG
jgi:uncharacterized membrane protein